MNSASILMNVTTAAPPVTAAEPASNGDGFNQALAAAQVVSKPVQDTQDTPDKADPDNAQETASAALALISGMLTSAVTSEGSTGTGDAGAADADACAEPDATAAVPDGAAAILAQMLAGSSSPTPAAQPPTETAAASAIVVQQARVPGQGAAGTADSDIDEEATGKEGGKRVAGLDAALPDAAADSDALAVLEKSPALATTNTPLPQSASQTGNSAQAAVQAAANALRDSTPVPASPAPVQATLRSPVGTAKWADELGNRLVLMSVRGQQQGSLTLTPEHLGPVEVQISVNRDVANVWFGAQHADTRAALTDAMPRLRELLASSGLSLGQSGVSEQASRQGFASADPRSAGGSATLDTDSVTEAPVQTWRVWRPGVIDTYA